MHNINSASDVLRKKKQNFAAFSGENSRENRPISRGFSREKSQNSQKNRLISPEISGGNFAKKQSVKNSRFRWVLFWQISPKSINFASIWPALFNVFLTGIIICSFNNSSLEKWAKGSYKHYAYCPVFRNVHLKTPGSFGTLFTRCSDEASS